MKITDRKLTQKEFDTMTGPLELDLLAYFKILEELVMSATFDKTQTPEELISSIMEIFDGPTGSIQVQKEDRPIGFRIYQGMLIGIENLKGSVRSGTDPNGHKWSIKMNYDYGYIYNTKAIDGDSLDAYIGPEETDKVFIVKQVDPNTKEFDELKVMFGFNDKNEAILAYRSQYDDPKFYGGIVEYSLAQFKQLIFGGHDAKSKAR